MNVLDIILLILLALGVYEGFRDGIIVQLGGIAGLLLGVYFAFRFGPWVSSLLAIPEDFSRIAGFIIVLLAVILIVTILSRLLSKVLNVTGLGILNKLGGVILAVFKTGLILGLLLYCFDYLNRRQDWVEKQTLEKSALYSPLIGVAEFAFPYIDFVKEKLLELPRSPEGGSENEDPLPQT